MKLYYDTTNSATYPQPGAPSWTRISAIVSFPKVKNRMDETGIIVVEIGDYEGALKAAWDAREWTRMKLEDEDSNVIFLGYLTGKTYGANQMVMSISDISQVFQWFPLDKNYALAEGYIDDIAFGADTTRLDLVQGNENRDDFAWLVDKWIDGRDVAIMIRDNSTGNTLETWLYQSISQVGGEDEFADPGWEDDPDGSYYRIREINEITFNCVVTPVLGGDNIIATNTVSKIEIFYDFVVQWLDFVSGSVALEVNRGGTWVRVAGAFGGNQWWGNTSTRVNGSMELIADDLTDYLTLDGANWDEMLGVRLVFGGDFQPLDGTQTLLLDYLKVEITYNADNISPISEIITANGASYIQTAGVNWEEMGITDGGAADGDIFVIGENTQQIIEDIAVACNVNILQLTASTKYMAQQFKGNFGLQILKKVCLLEGWHWWVDFTDGIFGTILVGHLDDLEDSGIDLTQADYDYDWKYDDDSNYFSKIIVYGNAAYRIQQTATSQSIASPKTKTFYEETITTNAEALEVAEKQLEEWSVKHPSIKLVLKGVNAAIKVGTKITLTMVRPTVAEADYPVRMVERERLGHGDIKTTIYAGMGHTTLEEKLGDRINAIMYLAQKSHADRLVLTPAAEGVTGVSWGDIADGDAGVDARIVVQNTDPAGTIDIAIDALIAAHVIAGHTLNQINNPSGDKEFNFANKHLHFKWVAPAAGAHQGAFEIEASGAFQNDLVHIHQHTGNPGASRLVYVEAEDSDVLPLEVKANLTTDIAIKMDTGIFDANDNDIDNVASILFDIDNGATPEEGRLLWNATDGTLEVGMPGGSVNLQIGQEELIRVKNITGVQIDNGAAVRINGVDGNHPTIGLSDANNPAAAGCIGLATEDIAHNDYGYVTTSGMVRDVNTNAWNVADRLFVSQDPGVLTNVYPSGTDRIILVGIVIKKSEAEGMIWVLPINQAHLAELSGVTIAAPADNELLVYDAGTGTWINQTPTEAEIISDVVYDADVWNGVGTIAPSKNAVRDVFVALTGATMYQGTWDPANAYPASGVGFYYIVSADGYKAAQGDGTPARWYEIGDWIIYNTTETEWDILRNVQGDNILKVSPGDDIQVAVDEIESIGAGVVKLLPGTHTLTAPLTVNNVNVDLVINGSGATSIVDLGADRTFITITNCKTCVLKDFAIDANDLTTDVKEVIVISEVNDNPITIRDLIMDGDGANGIFISIGSNNVRIENNKLTDGYIGILSGNASKCYIMNNIVSEMVYQDITFDTMFDSIITGNNIDGGGTALYGIGMEDSDDNIITNNILIDTAHLIGISLIRCDNNIISNNSVIDSVPNNAADAIGININNASDYNAITGNIVADGANAGAGGYIGIKILGVGNSLVNNITEGNTTNRSIGGTDTKTFGIDDIQLIAVRLDQGTIVNTWTSTPMGQMGAADTNAEISYTGHAPANMEAMVNPNLILSFSGGGADNWAITVRVNSAGHGDAQGSNLHNGAEALGAAAGATFYTKTVALVGTISPSDIIGIRVVKTSNDAQVLYMSMACWIERA